MSARDAPAAAERRTRGQRTRERILDAALEILAEQGPRGLTHRAVAERAEVSLGTTTYHFASRREMVREAFQLHLRRTRQATERAPVYAGVGLGAFDLARGASWSPESLAESVAESMATALQDERASCLATFELQLERARDAELREELAADTGVEALAGLVARAGSPQPREDAALIAALLQGLAIDWLSRPDDPDHVRQVQRLLERLLGALYPDEDGDRGGADR